MIPLLEDKITDNRNRKNYRGVIMESDFPHKMCEVLWREIKAQMKTAYCSHTWIVCICLRWTNIGQAERNILKRAEKGLIC